MEALVDDHKRKSPFSKEKGDFFVGEKGRGDKVSSISYTY